ncbi:MAG TPA: discoidin domain-containing protein, partial [Roseimicrobium sp.]|nr:discoidin domain-containing protein [Roseimicrobium sp.]
PGYKLELVLSEPDIKEPVVAAFDGNGRMFVAEMRSYMQDIDGTKELEPVSRVSLHWSSRKNGKFDRHSVFIDKLILPRMILPLGQGELLVNETDTNDIFLYRDTNNDGVADEKTLWYAGGKRGGNLEHQQSGLIWGMDNWMYMTYNAWRLRWTGTTNVLKEDTAGNGGQWGLTQDNYGKPWFVNAGGEKGPLNFQTHIAYGALNTKEQFEPGFAEVWPLVGLADVQGGNGRFRPEDKTLNHFTATCGQEVFRGDRLPADMIGDLFFSEPVGRLIRRSKIEVKDGLTILHNPYPKSEFIRSTDANFRVVNMNNAPDGTLYLLDMYRGIIQEGNWVKEGSYLRKVVQQYSMDKNFGRGRIWRLVHKDFKPGPQPNMNKETPAQLVAHLEHPNGWWRDTAQKLLVLKADKSVAPALETMSRSSANHLARIHALWTLEGLGALEASLVREKMKDEHPQVRAAAIRTGETLFKAGDKSLATDITNLANDKAAEVSIQAMLTAKLLKLPEAMPLLRTSLTSTNATPGVKEIATQLLMPTRTWGKEFSDAQKKLLERGDAIYKELCFACHGTDGRGMPMDGRPGITMAPPLGVSRTVLGHRDGILNVLLKGLAGPVNGKAYDAQMVTMESNDDEWIAAIASYVRNSFGNAAGTIEIKDSARVRKALKDRTEPWTIEELHASLPNPPLTNKKQWKLEASHNAAAVKNAIDGNPDTRYDTKGSQEKGMWLTIELPAETAITGIVLDQGKSAGDWPRGYTVEFSADGKTWGEPAVTGKGTPGMTDITFKPVKTKFIKIMQTGEVKGTYWSIHEMDILEDAPARPFAKAAGPAKKKESFE